MKWHPVCSGMLAFCDKWPDEYCVVFVNMSERLLWIERVTNKIYYYHTDRRSTCRAIGNAPGE